MNLSDIFSSLNQQHFSGELPLPKLTWNSRLRSSAGRFCPGSRNILKPRAPLIEIASYLQELDDGLLHITDTLLHEMIHYWLWIKHKPYGHTPEFHHIMKRVGARRYNPVPKLSAVKYWYECPRCLHKSPARRRLGSVACLSCCKKWNQGKYHENFRLRIAGAQAPMVAPEQNPATPAPLPISEILRRLEDLRNIIKKTSSKNTKLAPH